MLSNQRLGENFFNAIDNPEVHGKWLNTLAMLENSGARKIAASEDPINVDLERLSHASEEKRHAYFFKKLIAKVSPQDLPNFKNEYVLGGNFSRRLLDKLDAKICRLLKKEYGITDLVEIKRAAYYLTTYAIEIRAMNIYVPYEEYLQQKGFGFSLRSVLLEEQKHLAEIEEKIDEIFNSDAAAVKKSVCQFEKAIFKSWTEIVHNQCLSYQ